VWGTICTTNGRQPICGIAFHFIGTVAYGIGGTFATLVAIEPGGGRTVCSIRGTVTKGAVGTRGTLVAIEPGGGRTVCSIRGTVTKGAVGTRGTRGAVEPICGITIHGTHDTIEKVFGSAVCSIRGTVAYRMVGACGTCGAVEPGGGRTVCSIRGTDAYRMVGTLHTVPAIVPGGGHTSSPFATVAFVMVDTLPTIDFIVGRMDIGEKARTFFVCGTVAFESVGAGGTTNGRQPICGIAFHCIGTVTDGVWGAGGTYATGDPSSGSTVCYIRGAVTDGVWGAGFARGTIEPGVLVSAYFCRGTVAFESVGAGGTGIDRCPDRISANIFQGVRIAVCCMFGTVACVMLGAVYIPGMFFIRTFPLPTLATPFDHGHNTNCRAINVAYWFVVWQAPRVAPLAPLVGAIHKMGVLSASVPENFGACLAPDALPGRIANAGAQRYLIPLYQKEI
jgi:hypothetical protein